MISYNPLRRLPLALMTISMVSAVGFMGAVTASAQTIKSADEIARDLDGSLSGKSGSKAILGGAALPKSLSPELRQRLTRALSDAEDLPTSTPAATPAAGQSTPPKPQVAAAQTVPVIPAADREQLAQEIDQRGLPDTNVVVLFELDSDRLTPASLPQLDELGKAMKDPKFNGLTFVIAGHTDAMGTPDYNLNLSQRRANAVKKYLSEKFQVSAGLLLPVGYGKDKLKNAAKPFSPENRRVQIVNGGSTTTASNTAATPSGGAGTPAAQNTNANTGATVTKSK